jgi:Na+/alanine symporter
VDGSRLCYLVLLFCVFLRALALVREASSVSTSNSAFLQLAFDVHHAVLGAASGLGLDSWAAITNKQYVEKIQETTKPYTDKIQETTKPYTDAATAKAKELVDKIEVCSASGISVLKPETYYRCISFCRMLHRG